MCTVRCRMRETTSVIALALRTRLRLAVQFTRVFRCVLLRGASPASRYRCHATFTRHFSVTVLARHFRTVVPLLRAHCFVSRPLVEKINPRSVSRGSYFAERRMHREDEEREREIERERERERELKAARKRARSFQITSFPGSRAASTLPAENVKNPNVQRARGRKEGRRRERRGVAVLKLLKPVYRVRGNACYECYISVTFRAIAREECALRPPATARFP